MVKRRELTDGSIVHPRGCAHKATGRAQCYTFVLMESTLGMARSLGWKVHMRFARFRAKNRLGRWARYPDSGGRLGVNALATRLFGRVSGVGIGRETGKRTTPLQRASRRRLLPRR